MIINIIVSSMMINSIVSSMINNSMIVMKFNSMMSWLIWTLRRYALEHHYIDFTCIRPLH